VLLNAGAALAVYDAPAEPPEESLAAGIERARAAVDTGAAQSTLERWVAASGA
jgi:anthranilate phosphoribosyltransferase